jgi:ribosomal protein S6
MRYELCYLVGESKEQDFARIKKEISAVVSDEGGKWSELQIEEKRKMAYRVGKEVRGVYVTQQFEIVKDEEKEDGEKINPLDHINKKLNLYNDILRFIIVKAEDLPELKVREGNPVFAKDSGKNERGNYKKPVYFKKTETAPKEKTEVKKPADTSSDNKTMASEEEKIPVPEAEVKREKKEEKISEDKTENKKSIDEKIDEILNI